MPPCAAVAVPDHRVDVGYRNCAAGDAGVVAGIAAAGRGFAVVQHQHRIACFEVRLHGGKQRSVGRCVQRVRDGIRIEFAGQHTQRRTHLRGAANAGVQALVIGLTEGQLLAGRTGTRAGGRNRQGNTLNEFFVTSVLPSIPIPPILSVTHTGSPLNNSLYSGVLKNLTSLSFITK